MKIIVYTKDNCPLCVQAKQLLKSKVLAFEEYNVEDPNVCAMFTQLYPDVRQMPQIFINGQRVGGFAGLQAALSSMGL